MSNLTNVTPNENFDWEAYEQGDSNTQKEFEMFNKKVNYVKKIVPLMCLAVAPIFTACDKKNEPGKELPKSELETVEFNFGPGIWSNINAAPDIASDAVVTAGQNSNIGTIKFISNGISMEGSPGNIIINRRLNPAFAAANGKGKGEGNIEGMDLKYAGGEADSLRLVQWGFKVNQNTYNK